MTRLRSSFLPLSLLATSLLPLACGGSDDTTTEAPVCMELKSYTPSSTNQVTFAQVYPILANTTSTGSGCSQAAICHGTMPLAINSAGKTLQFLFSPENMAMAKADLLTASVNAPAMQRVAPGSVQNSLLSYKISGKDGLNCIKSMCTAGATVGTMTACGDPMPTIGTLSAAERTTILDWIAGGAVD
jgi:hypothetical protein